jgi:hypothetical protein
LFIWSRVVNNFFLLWVVSRTVNQAKKKQMHKYCWKWNQIIRRLFFVQYTRHILKLQNPSPVEYLRVRSWYQVQTGYLRVLSRYQIQRRILRTTTRIINTSTDHHSGGFSVCPSDTEIHHGLHQILHTATTKNKSPKKLIELYSNNNALFY